MIVDIIDKKKPACSDPVHYTNIGPAGIRMRIELSYMTVVDNEWVEREYSPTSALDMVVSGLDIQIGEATISAEGLPVQELNITGLLIDRNQPGE